MCLRKITVISIITLRADFSQGIAKFDTPLLTVGNTHTLVVRVLICLECNLISFSKLLTCRREGKQT